MASHPSNQFLVDFMQRKLESTLALRKGDWMINSLRRVQDSIASFPAPLSTYDEFMKLKGVGSAYALMLMTEYNRHHCIHPSSSSSSSSRARNGEQKKRRTPKQKSLKWFILKVFQQERERSLALREIQSKVELLEQAVGQKSHQGSVIRACQGLEADLLLERTRDERNLETFRLTKTGRSIIAKLQDIQVQQEPRPVVVLSGDEQDEREVAPMRLVESERGQENREPPNQRKKPRLLKASLSSCSTSSLSIGPVPLRQLSSNKQKEKQISPHFTFTPKRGTEIAPCSDREAIAQGDLRLQVDWQVVLLLDNRERILHSNKHEFETRLLSQGVVAETRCLPLGDFLWIFRRGSEEIVSDYIIERKQVVDLAISIKDGRYQEQKLRLHNCGLKHVMYLVEGNVKSNTSAGISAKALETAMSETQVRDGFALRKTENYHETVQFLVNMTKLIESTTTLAHRNKSNLSTVCGIGSSNRNWDGPAQHLMTFEEFKIRNEKKKLSTAGDIFGAQIKQIKGFSGIKAATVVDKYPTPLKMFMCYERDLASADDHTRKMHFEHLKPPGLSQRIGPTLSMKLHDFYTAT